MSRQFYTRTLFASLLLAISFSCQKETQVAGQKRISEITEKLIQARSTNTIIQPVSASYPELTLKEAYAVQAEPADKLSLVYGPLSGYKLGYADSSSLISNNLDIPAFGPLFKNQIKQSGDTIPAKDFRNFSIENEIVFKIGGTIDTPVNSVNELLPFVESVHIGFDMSEGIFGGKSTVVDFITNGAGSKYFVLGEGMDPAATDVSDIMLTVAGPADSIVYQGSSINVLGNPWYALLDVANDLANRGYPLKKGDVIFSGKVAPAYKVSFNKAAGIYKGSGEPFSDMHIVVQ